MLTFLFTLFKIFNLKHSQTTNYIYTEKFDTYYSKEEGGEGEPKHNANLVLLGDIKFWMALTSLQEPTY